jgi:hypothetical protein
VHGPSCFRSYRLRVKRGLRNCEYVLNILGSSQRTVAKRPRCPFPSLEGAQRMV